MSVTQGWKKITALSQCLSHTQRNRVVERGSHLPDVTQRCGGWLTLPSCPLPPCAMPLPGWLCFVTGRQPLMAFSTLDPNYTGHGQQQVSHFKALPAHSSEDQSWDLLPSAQPPSL